MQEKGMIVVFTGDGKGKTSAALGIALRASRPPDVRLSGTVREETVRQRGSEVRGTPRPHFEFASLGKGFVNCCGGTTSLKNTGRLPREALEAARQRMHSGGWDILILDEINTAVSLGLLDVEAGP